MYPLPGQAPKEITVSGTVLNSATGQAISGALVVLQPGMRREFVENERNDDGVVARSLAARKEPDSPRRAITDAAGRFSFTLPNVVYAHLQISRRGFRTENGMDAASVALDGDEMEKGVQSIVKLTPQGAIEGKVVNEDGEPLPGVGV